MSEFNFARVVRVLLRASATAALMLGASAAAHAASFVVNVGGGMNAYSPPTLSIKRGDTVTFINRGGFHNVVADNGSFRCARGCDGDGHGGNGAASSTNWIATVTFPKAGKVGYFCEIHGAPGQGMFGTINVVAPLPPPIPVPNGGWAFAVLLAGALALIAAARLRRHRSR